MTNETFTETTKNKVATWSTLVTVEYSPATVEDLDWSARWFLVLKDEIVSVRKVRVTRQTLPVFTSPLDSDGYEVAFRCGARGWVGCSGHQELDALVVGTTGYIHGLAVWKNNSGRLVGAPVFWYMAQKGPRKRLNVDRAPRCCAAELYARAAGKSWG